MQKRTEFTQALKAVANERGLDASIIIDSIEQAIVAAFRRDARERGEEVDELEYEVELNPISGEAKIFLLPEDKDGKKKDVTPPGFGRIAAQTAKQVIRQKIREAEKDAIMDEFSGRIGNLISGVILRFDGPNVRVDIGRTEAIMTTEERIPNERLSAGQRLTFLLKKIEEGPRGKDIILSRADDAFVSKLFEREVPEVASGSVEIKIIAREPGVRTKIAVFSNQSGVDPVGSNVGQKGVRVQAVTNELGGERVDIVLWSPEVKELIKASLAPVEPVKITLDKAGELAQVTVPEDDLSFAIGKDGQNVRLAAKLAGVRIDIAGVDAPSTLNRDRDSEEGKPDKGEEPKEVKAEKSEVKKEKKDKKEKVKKKKDKGKVKKEKPEAKKEE